jgi:hypothetical protein
MTEEEKEENKKIGRLRFVFDFAMEYIRTQSITHDDALKVVDEVRKFALNLFPGKEGAFDIIYASRFKRLLNEKFQRS